jgi:hypothetical protein
MGRVRIKNLQVGTWTMDAQTAWTQISNRDKLAVLANTPIAGKTYLKFFVSNNRGSRQVIVTLNENDLYDVQVFAVRNMRPVVKATIKNVGCENLGESIVNTVVALGW